MPLFIFCIGVILIWSGCASFFCEQQIGREACHIQQQRTPRTDPLLHGSSPPTSRGSSTTPCVTWWVLLLEMSRYRRPTPLCNSIRLFRNCTRPSRYAR